MKRGEAWLKFMESGNIEDYLAYRAEIEGRPSDISNAVANINNGVNKGFGVSNESTNKWFNNSGNGLWRKR